MNTLICVVRLYPNADEQVQWLMMMQYDGKMKEKDGPAGLVPE